MAVVLVFLWRPGAGGAPPGPERPSARPAGPRAAPGPFWGKNRSCQTIFRKWRPARTLRARCAPDATSGKLFLWAVFAAPGAPARFGGRQGPVGPVPVHFGRLGARRGAAGAWECGKFLRDIWFTPLD